MPSLPRASPTHLLVMAAAIMGTMYSRPPVSSNMMTTRETAGGQRLVVGTVTHGKLIDEWLEDYTHTHTHTHTHTIIYI